MQDFNAVNDSMDRRKLLELYMRLKGVLQKLSLEDCTVQLKAQGDVKIDQGHVKKLQIADFVTEMVERKHYYEKGVPARERIEI